MIRVLFEGGDFNTHNALLSGGVFSMYTLGLAGFLILDLLSKAYFAMGRPLPPIGMATAVLGICVGSNALFAHFMPAWPQLLAFGTSVGFLLVGGVAYSSFARKGGLTLPRKPLLRCCGFSLGIGGLALGRVPPASGIHGFQRVDGCGLQRRRRGVPVAVCAPHGALAAHT